MQTVKSPRIVLRRDRWVHLWRVLCAPARRKLGCCVGTEGLMGEMGPMGITRMVAHVKAQWTPHRGRVAWPSGSTGDRIGYVLRCMASKDAPVPDPSPVLWSSCAPIRCMARFHGGMSKRVFREATQASFKHQLGLSAVRFAGETLCMCSVRTSIHVAVCSWHQSPDHSMYRNCYNLS